MELILRNHIIEAPIIEILKRCKSELYNGKLRQIEDKGDWVSVTCPFHSDGVESHRSCGIVSDKYSKLEYGTFNCFTCKEKGPLYHFIGACFDKDDEFGINWLIDNFGDTIAYSNIDIPTLDLNKQEKRVSLSESILNDFQNWHPYMAQRKLTKDIVEKFKIKYDPKTYSIVFPVWDEYDNLVFLTRRSILTKQFVIDKGVDKPVYLLNYILKNNIKEVVVCESQINALTCWSKGIPAVALFGTGSSNQYKILNKSNIIHYILAFDGDDAGDNGRRKFMENVKGAFIDIVEVPRGKDVNDLTNEEFENYFKKYRRDEV